MNKKKAKQSFKSKNKKLWVQVVHCRTLYLMLIPSIVTVFIFHYIPLYGIQIAFKDYKSSLGFWDSPWIGFDHFTRFFRYPYFWQLIRNTFVINIVGLLNFPLPIIFAIMLNELRSLRLKKVCQTITYAPHFISTVLVCSMTMLFLDRNGLAGSLASLLGTEFTNLLAKPSAFPWIYSLSGLWSGLGWGTIIYTASLAGVSPELVEAARIDGATRMQTIWHVHLPHLRPTIITMLVLNMGSMLSVGFEKAYLLQNDLNKAVSEVISIYTYRMGLRNNDFSYSTAIGLFNSAVNLVFILLSNKIANKLSGYGLW